MKNRLTYLLAIGGILMASCDETEQPVNETKQGTISIQVEKENSMVVLETKIVTKPTKEDLTNFKIKIDTYKSDVLTTEGDWENYISSKDLDEGEYKVNATSTMISKTPVFNAPRYQGASDFVNIVDGKLSTATIACTIANSRISVAFDENFGDAFKTYSIEILRKENAEEKLIFNSENTNHTTESLYGYFESEELIVNFIGINNADEQVTKTLKTFTPNAKEWHKFNISAVATSGKIDFEISIDDTITEISEDIEIDPFE
ncbi:MAG: DUF4493 domain-containing protein [Bacteroidetes bacterium]|nr:DUF4493 domain-containing protein [Bacteroidota bacterium]